MNTDLRKKTKNDFEKDFFTLMNNAVFAKIMENLRKHRDIKLATTQRKRNYLVSEPYYSELFDIILKSFSQKICKQQN